MEQPTIEDNESTIVNYLRVWASIKNLLCTRFAHTDDVEYPCRIHASGVCFDRVDPLVGPCNTYSRVRNSTEYIAGADTPLPSGYTLSTLPKDKTRLVNP